MVETDDLAEHCWHVLDTLDPHVAVLDRTGEIVTVNAAWEDFASENGGDGSRCGVGANYLAVCQAGGTDQYARAALEGIIGVLDGVLPTFMMEYPCHAPDAERWFVMTARPLRRSDGGGAVVTHADVTGKHHAETQTLHEQRRFASLIEHAVDLISVMDRDGRTTYESPAFESMLGYSREEAAGTDAFAFLHPDDVEVVRQMLHDTAQLSAGTISREIRMRHRDGSWRWFEATLTNLLDDPDVCGIVVNSRDVTERKTAEVDRAQRAESFSTLFHATAEAMVIHDGTVFVSVNHAYAALIGLEPEQVTGRPLLDFVAPPSHALAIEQMRHGAQVPYDLVAHRADGSTFLVELLGRQIQYEGRWLRLLTVRDVTQQRFDEEALRASEARQALLLRLAQTQRETRDADHMMAMASEALGRYLVAHRVGFFEMVDDATMIASACWTDGTLPLLSGTIPSCRFRGGSAAEGRAGHTLSIADLRRDPRTADTAFTGSGEHAGIGVPIVRRGKWQAGLFVDHASVRGWTADEVALAHDVAEQTWDAVERGRAETALRESEARFRALVQESSDIVVVFNATGRVRYASPALERVLGYPVDVFVDSRRLELVHRDDRDAVVRAWTTVLVAPETGKRVSCRTLNADGTWVWLEAIVTNLLHVPEVGGIVMNARDVSEQKRLEANLRHLALHDPLTGLPNRTLLTDRMDQALRQAAQASKRVGLLFLDLNYFKQVNDAFGHEAGDGLLHAVAERLRSIVQVAETVARLGGDEFVLLVPSIRGERHAMVRAEQVQSAMATPFIYHGREVAIGVTIGIAVSEPGLLQPAILLRDGDAALYRAKRAGRGHLIVHAPGMTGNATRRWRLKTDMREAADRGELTMHYQPIVAMTSGIVTGMEALLRWQHPVYGLVPPDEFIPLAEEAGQIVALGRWGVTQVCETLRRWGPEAPAIALNFSATQFVDPNLVRDIAAQVARTAIDPGKLRLEITEQIMIEDLVGTVSTLTQLRDLGVDVLIDDFGSGYSSLRYLRDLPVTGVKLDRSFMRGLETDPGAQAMLTGIVSLAHAIGLSVTAEGIETAGQLALIRTIGCDHGQGFYLARPRPAPTGEPIKRVDVPTDPPWTWSGTSLA